MANVNDTSTSTANDLQPRGTPERTRSVLECVVLWILEENLPTPVAESDEFRTLLSILSSSPRQYRMDNDIRRVRRALDGRQCTGCHRATTSDQSVHTHLLQVFFRLSTIINFPSRHIPMKT
ncbi:hypothetical protein EVG20_g2396 [Dentipellis fragilis]|uniref:Uncharacterized protein n=1 Tax=Dentipellis fragilis TaxID=205917 RepID=A0A4Y9Z9X1_9AGAM|nr:hypothetical protein EVG20_g2396 [Dentipellis fragilis]